jgi:uncharacterized protein with HEPN domain
MTRKPFWRAHDILRAISEIHTLLEGQSLASVTSDAMRRAALERHLEVISEASRFIPLEWRQVHAPSLPWRAIADLGNLLRHAYHRVDIGMLWDIYDRDLPGLESAMSAMIAAHQPPDQNDA